MRRKLLLAALALAITVSAAAANFYVTDQLEITLRSGPGLGFKILEMVPSGASLQRVEEQDGWAKVRTASGTEGWVVARYLTTEPPKGPRLAAAQGELEKLRGENRQLREDLQGSRSQENRSSGEVKRLTAKLGALEKEYTAWKAANQDVITLKQRADTMEQEQQAAHTELERLRAENRSLQAREKFYWFFSGVVVLLLGWVLGYMYASSRHRAKSQSRMRYS